MLSIHQQILIAVAVIALLGLAWYFFGRKTMEKFAGAPKVTVTYYFMKNCPWCQKLQPEWEKFKNAITAEKLDVTTVEVDAEQNTDKVSKKNISGFPTVRITGKDGKETEYEGDRTAAALLAEVKKHL
jgi:glutaredoxin